MVFLILGIFNVWGLCFVVVLVLFWFCSCLWFFVCVFFIIISIFYFGFLFCFALFYR